MTNCLECGRQIDEESHFCQYCGRELPGEEEKVEEEREFGARGKTELPVIGGILIIISSVFVFITVMLVLHQRESNSQEWFGGLISDWPDWFLAILVIFGVIGIIGGLSSMARKSQALGIVGGIFSSFGVGGAIGVVGLALVAAAEHEFRSALSDYTEPSEMIDSSSFEKPGFGWRH